MEDLRQQLAENPQAAVTFATTEHFNLQTERAATIGEANGRASIFLGSVSAGLIALGFAAQGGNSAATMRAFALVLFPVLVFLGLSTFEAAVRSLGLMPRPGQVLLTVAGAISIVNGALVGVWVGMAVSLLPGPAVVPAGVGLAAMVGAALGQHRYQLGRRQVAPAPFALGADAAHPRTTP